MLTRARSAGDPAVRVPAAQAHGRREIQHVEFPARIPQQVHQVVQALDVLEPEPLPAKAIDQYSPSRRNTDQDVPCGQATDDQVARAVES